MANNENNKDLNWIYDHEELDLNKVTSATDCTGLMPTPSLSDEEAESYNDIYTIPEKDSNPKHNKREQDNINNSDPF